MEISRRKTESDCTIAGLYDLSETIGKGHFAVVKLAKHVFTGEKVAVKVIDKTKLDPISKEHLFQEVRCMKLVQHPHIVRLYEVIDTQTKLYLILELGDGDMYDYIMNNHDRGLDIDTARMYFTQILEAISYCHDLHVVHRDLKPENVIFFEKLGIVKLTDFGFSNRFEPDTKLDTSCGSLAYSAPEILLGDSYDAPAVDVWSLGVLLYMLVCGDPPFQEANDNETLTMIMDCKYRIPSHVDKDCAKLITSMLKREPKERIGLAEIVSHPWMNRDGSQCCENLLCTSLVGREHVTPADHNDIIERMVEGGFPNKAEIQRALDSNEYSNLTATYYLLAEKRLKRIHAADVKASPSIKSRPVESTAWPHRLEHSISTPDDSIFYGSTSDGIKSNTLPKSAPHDRTDAPVVFPDSNIGIQHSDMFDSLPSRKFSLINEEEEEESDEDDLRSNVISVKETKSSQLSHPGADSCSAVSDFEQSLSNMSIRRSRPNTAQPTSSSRPMRTVGSSPQLLPLKQIHEEQEVTSDDDALSTHSQTSVVKLRHSSLSMASPELARKLLHKKNLMRSKTQSGSDTSDNDEDKPYRESKSPTNSGCSSLHLPHKRKDSSTSSDNDGPSPATGASSGAVKCTSHPTTSTTSGNGGGTQASSPQAKKKYSGGNTNTKDAALSDVNNSSKTEGVKSSSTTINDPQKTNSNSNNKADCDMSTANSLKVLANKLVDSSLARLSNFSLASQSSSISSRSSVKYSCNTTPRSSQRRSKDGNKFSKSRLMKQLRMDFTDLSDRELTDSECSNSLQSSLRLKISTQLSPDYCSVIAEEQSPQLSPPHNKKKGPECCSIM